MSCKAYLVVELCATHNMFGDIQRIDVIGTGIYSSPGDQLTVERYRYFATLLTEAAEDYQTASDNLKKWIKEAPMWQWAWNLLPENQPPPIPFG